MLLLLGAACGSRATTTPTLPAQVLPSSPSSMTSNPCNLLAPSDIEAVLKRPVAPGQPDPTIREPNCFWRLTDAADAGVSVRLYTDVMPLWYGPQPQDTQVVSGLAAIAKWDTRAHYLAVRSTRQAFKVQVYSSDSADQQLEDCTEFARIILQRLPE